ncbi:mannose-6-phosphate isomerase, class I [Vibrio sp. A1-b2]|uniref:mannose-6-phosphate isomerase, class I n=1 Tax=Vibrio sp. A1-b2 TaxID=2912248 RepID=UPI001F02E8DD|nr:mannose-6-phosphate isomerase, class I [Vibrio sp. A1-b2]MCF7364460.1 mannose-6-phosphate isomerase, class I [Vibrio sp. A1-b2]
MDNSIFKLDNVVQHYPWGSSTALSELFGIDNPDHVPQAEIWMGSHPNGCSKILTSGKTLAELILEDPNQVLGNYTADRFGDLPFLFKVLAAEKPLSVQVHPSKKKAEEGFEKENSLGIALGASNRNFKDGNHKPELVYALTFYKAMNGFRPISDIVSLFNQAKIESLRNDIDTLQANQHEKGLKVFFSVVMNLSGERKQQALSELFRALADGAKTLKAREAFSLISEFKRDYDDDIGLFSPLLLNVIELEPGDAMFLHAETPHAYVRGVGLEIMANSDNVLRAGLTPKYMDVSELIENTKFIPTPSERIKLRPYQMENKLGYPIPVDDFGFEIINVDSTSRKQYVRSAEILFCIEGKVDITVLNTTVTLVAGESAFVSCNSRGYNYRGSGVLARAFN